MRGSRHAEALREERSSTSAVAGRTQTIEQLARIEEYFWPLMRHANSRGGAVENAEPVLGGRLLYAGVLNEEGRALATAGNVAGAATLAAATDSMAQKSAVRDGVVDFLVNSLDEALRILKNEIRKREPVAVCVSVSPDQMECEMRERGVQPDLLAEVGGAMPGAKLRRRDTGVVRAEPVDAAQAWLAWSVADAPAQWMPKLDALAAACVSTDERETLRWLRHAPRYVSRMARGVRVLRCAALTGEAVLERMREAVERGTIGAPVWMESRFGGGCVEREWKPPATSDAP